RDSAMDLEGTACYIVNFFREKYTKNFLARFINISEKDFLESHPQEILKDISIAKSNSNLKQAAQNIVHDVRAGHFGT
ncbi:ribosome biogenesis GTPase YlqF, partial [Francisella tularensis subsp. holarctica]|nr:ribosome biogenesis GTPase YlqF [Francisella tularensis subsp. holarctica]